MLVDFESAANNRQTVEGDAAAQERHLSPAIRRINLTSDYESSESPCNSEHDENTNIIEEQKISNVVIPDRPTLEPLKSVEIDEVC